MRAHAQPALHVPHRVLQTYRHALAATTLRVAGDGTPYLYTLNLSCRQSMWDDLQPVFKVGVFSVIFGLCVVRA